MIATSTVDAMVSRLEFDQPEASADFGVANFLPGDPVDLLQACQAQIEATDEAKAPGATWGLGEWAWNHRWKLWENWLELSRGPKIGGLGRS